MPDINLAESRRTHIDTDNLGDSTAFKMIRGSGLQRTAPAL